MDTLKPIKSESEYESALKEMDLVFHSKPNTIEGDKLEALSMLNSLV
jgi:HTH-type transcriptional regulator / antitoxin HigA